MSSALVLGSTGAIGKVLLKELLGSGLFTKVTAITRREFEYDGPNKELLNKQIIDFENIDNFKDAFKDHNVGFCCLGTTRKLAGSAENFYKIDHDYTIKAAEIFKSVNADSKTPLHFLLISAMNANAKSSFLYPKTKGKIEEDLIAMKFPRLSIFRPSILLNRNNDFRFGEYVAQVLVPLANIVRPKKDSVPVPIVGKALLNLSQIPPRQQPDEDGNVVEFIDNKTIHELAGLSLPEKKDEVKDEKKENEQ